MAPSPPHAGTGNRDRPGANILSVQVQRRAVVHRCGVGHISQAAPLPIFRVPACTSTVPLNVFAGVNLQGGGAGFHNAGVSADVAGTADGEIVVSRIVCDEHGSHVDTSTNCNGRLHAGGVVKSTLSPAENVDDVLLARLSQLGVIVSQVVSDVELQSSARPDPLTVNNTDPGEDRSIHTVVKCVPVTTGLKPPDKVPV